MERKVEVSFKDAPQASQSLAGLGPRPPSRSVSSVSSISKYRKAPFMARAPLKRTQSIPSCTWRDVEEDSFQAPFVLNTKTVNDEVDDKDFEEEKVEKKESKQKGRAPQTRAKSLSSSRTSREPPKPKTPSWSNVKRHERAKKGQQTLRPYIHSDSKEAAVHSDSKEAAVGGSVTPSLPSPTPCEEEASTEEDEEGEEVVEEATEEEILKVAALEPNVIPFGFYNFHVVRILGSSRFASDLQLQRLIKTIANPPLDVIWDHLCDLSREKANAIFRRHIKRFMALSDKEARDRAGEWPITKQPEQALRTPVPPSHSLVRVHNKVYNGNIPYWIVRMRGDNTIYVTFIGEREAIKLVGPASPFLYWCVETDASSLPWKKYESDTCEGEETKKPAPSA